MDIKDFILISGGLLIALVIGHGFWIAWRAKREPLRLDIVPDLANDDVDDLERLRGELPNGGARVVPPRQAPMEQTSLVLDDADQPAPVLMDVAHPQPDDDDPLFAEPTTERTPRQPVRRPRPLGAEPAPVAVKDVDMPIVAEPPAPRPRARPEAPERAPLFGRANRERAAQTPLDPRIETAPVEELLILNVLAPRGSHFEGEALINALRAQGLKYGDMSIFHRVDPATKAKLFSVANAIEPGTFDLADIEAVMSPGVSFFLQLPGPEDAIGAFDLMLDAARNVALDLGGEVKDEQLSVLTGQTAEHMRQRIAEFARRRLSMRA